MFKATLLQQITQAAQQQTRYHQTAAPINLPHLVSAKKNEESYTAMLDRVSAFVKVCLMHAFKRGNTF